MNFGGGEEDGEVKKSKEERHKEIMEKSKAYKYHAQEIKEANKEAIHELDDDYKDMVGLLDFKPTGRKKEPRTS